MKRDPALWGISADIVRLDTSAEDVTVRRAARGGRAARNERIVTAKRSDPFDLLHDHVVTGPDGEKRRALSEDQHRAARRLMRDWCIVAGVRDVDRPELGKIDGGGSDPQLVNQAMIDAGGRRAAALMAIGAVNAALMRALIGRMVDECSIMAWRGLVQKVTGESDRNVQGALVRQACEALRLHYQEVDAGRVSDTRKHTAQLRPFGGASAA